MSYTPPLKVRYGTSAEPWHSLSPWYHAGTTLPLKRDYTQAPRRVPIRWAPVLGQAPPAGSYVPPSFWERWFTGYGLIYTGALTAAFTAGALTMHLMHKYRVLGMNRRPRRNPETKKKVRRRKSRVQQSQDGLIRRRMEELTWYHPRYAGGKR